MEAILWDRFQLKILEPKIERRVYEFWIQNSKNIKVEKNIGNNNFQLLQKKYHIKYGSKCVRLNFGLKFYNQKILWPTYEFWSQNSKNIKVKKYR